MNLSRLPTVGALGEAARMFRNEVPIGNQPEAVCGHPDRNGLTCPFSGRTVIVAV
ncbi:MAG: hypothetical protein Q8P40_02030 [Nitrospirota bacterium]|nr:hypothetical protein [Nitrospirota bacterium]